VARVKGTQLAGLVQALRGLHKQRSVSIPEQLLGYLGDDKVIVSNWYPEQDFRDMMLIVGRAVAPTVEGNVWRYLGKQGALRDIAGVYAPWVRQGDPERTLQFLHQGWSAVRDSGRVSMTMLGPKQAEVLIRGYPVMCSELAETNAGYFEELIKATGVTDVEVHVRELIDAGARWSVGWR
jgi:uncharacterized protein (TIGR02265 family)